MKGLELRLIKTASATEAQRHRERVEQTGRERKWIGFGMTGSGAVALMSELKLRPP
jgi:hypothetical protein